MKIHVFSLKAVGQNIYDTVYEYSKQDNTYIHFNEYLKLGIYPSSNYAGSPIGIYGYPLKYFKDDLHKYNSYMGDKSQFRTKKDKSTLQYVFPVLSYKEDENLRYGIIFTYTGDRNRIFRFDNYNRSDFYSDYASLAEFLEKHLNIDLETSKNILNTLLLSKGVSYFDPEVTYKYTGIDSSDFPKASTSAVTMWSLTRNIARLLAQRDIHSSQKYRGSVIHYDFYDEHSDENVKIFDEVMGVDSRKIMNILNHKTWSDTNSSVNPIHVRKWASIFRHLGYEGISDFGSGSIHQDERHEAIFMSARYLKILDVIYL